MAAMRASTACPGTAAPIAIEFLDAAGSVCGALLPTGHAVDHVAGVDATLHRQRHAGRRARAPTSVGSTGYEPRDVLNDDRELKARLEEIRLEAGKLMGLGDVANKVVPKMASSRRLPQAGICARAASSRTNAMHRSASSPP